jgi:hypothetical protein
MSSSVAFTFTFLVALGALHRSADFVGGSADFQGWTANFYQVVLARLSPGHFPHGLLLPPLLTVHTYATATPYIGWFLFLLLSLLHSFNPRYHRIEGAEDFSCLLTTTGVRPTHSFDRHTRPSSRRIQVCLTPFVVSPSSFTSP